MQLIYRLLADLTVIAPLWRMCCSSCWVWSPFCSDGLLKWDWMSQPLVSRHSSGNDFDRGPGSVGRHPLPADCLGDENSVPESRTNRRIRATSSPTGSTNPCSSKHHRWVFTLVLFGVFGGLVLADFAPHPAPLAKNAITRDVTACNRFAGVSGAETAMDSQYHKRWSQRRNSTGWPCCQPLGSCYCRLSLTDRTSTTMTTATADTPATENGLRVIEDATCTFCGCVCDDIDISVDTNDQSDHRRQTGLRVGEGVVLQSSH